MTGWLIMNGILSVGVLVVIVGGLAWAIVTDPGAPPASRLRTQASPHDPLLPYRSREGPVMTTAPRERIIGEPVDSVDGPAKVTGAAGYPRPGRRARRVVGGGTPSPTSRCRSD